MRFAQCTAEPVDVVPAGEWGLPPAEEEALFAEARTLEGLERLARPAPHHALLILARRLARGFRAPGQAPRAPGAGAGRGPPGLGAGPRPRRGLARARGAGGAGGGPRGRPAARARLPRSRAVAPDAPARRPRRALGARRRREVLPGPPACATRSSTSIAGPERGAMREFLSFGREEGIHLFNADRVFLFQSLSIKL